MDLENWPAPSSIRKKLTCSNYTDAWNEFLATLPPVSPVILAAITEAWVDGWVSAQDFHCRRPDLNKQKFVGRYNLHDMQPERKE